MKKLLFFISLFSALFCVNVSVADDDMDFDNFAVIDDDSGDDDMNLESVFLNKEFGPVDVRHFDIAGAMLGMSYDDIYNLPSK